MMKENDHRMTGRYKGSHQKFVVGPNAQLFPRKKFDGSPKRTNTGWQYGKRQKTGR